MSGPLRVAVLISGTGSNLKALLEARAAGRLEIDPVLVLSNRAAAPGLEHARAAGVATVVVNRESAGPGGEDEAVAEALREARPELVLLSGYMRILGAELVDEFRGRMINQHPSLLPKYKGLDTYRRVLEAGDAEHGASVHFVTAELDGGPVIAQVRVPVESGDDPERLAARLRPCEHALLLAVFELFCARRVEMTADGVTVDGAPLLKPMLLEGNELHA